MDHLGEIIVVQRNEDGIYRKTQFIGPHIGSNLPGSVVILDLPVYPDLEINPEYIFFSEITAL